MGWKGRCGAQWAAAALSKGTNPGFRVAWAASASRAQSLHEPRATSLPVFVCGSIYSDLNAHSGIGFDVALWTRANFWGVVFLGACQSNSSPMNTNYCTDLLHEISAEAIPIQAALQDEIFLLGTDSRK